VHHHHSVTQQDFWDDVQLALSLMERLETLVLIEMASPKIPYWTRILDHPYPFALEEVKLHLSFDDPLIRFLNAQAQRGGRLRAVRIYNTTSTDGGNDDEDDEGLVKSEQLVLPDVETLDISISLSPCIRPKSLPKLTHLQLSFDSPLNNELSPSQLLTILSHLILTTTPSSSRLRGLSLLQLPHHLSTAALLQHVIKLTNSTLSHLSHLHLPTPYPSQAFIKSQFLARLIEFPRLSSIELSLDSWDPAYTPPSHNNNSSTTTTTTTTAATIGPGIPPTLSPDPTSPPPFHLPTPVSQKALISELKTYCPTLRTIVFWYGKIRMRWAFVHDGLPFQLATTGASGTKEPSGSGNGDEEREMMMMMTTTTTTTAAASELCRIDNAAWSGEWHYRVETGQWAGHSRLWYTC
jgi:hypothetical protein